MLEITPSILPLKHPTAVVFGSFDGFHSGHQALFQRAQAIAQLHGLQSVVVSMAPRPAAFFAGITSPPLFLKKHRAPALAELGIDLGWTLEFNEALATVSAHDFVAGYVKDQLAASYLIAGRGFSLGAKARGDEAWLRTMAASFALEVDVLEPVQIDGQRVSSSVIRSLIAAGDVSRAARLLTRPYFVEGIVKPGDQRGRGMGFPTANLCHINQLLPREGVYRGRVWMPLLGHPTQPKIMKPQLKSLAPAVICVGRRPTFQGSDLSIEAHLLDRDLAGDALYGGHIGLYWQDFIRDNRKYDSVEDLKVQIAKDVELARRLFAQDL